MEKRKSWVTSNIASGLHTCLLTLREYSRKWRKWQSNIEAMLLQYSMLYGDTLEIRFFGYAAPTCNTRNVRIIITILDKSRGKDLDSEYFLVYFQ